MSFISTAYADPIAAPVLATSAAAHPTQPSMMPLFLILIVFGVFYFFMWRKQSQRNKEQQKLLSSIGKGEEVVTTSGIMGRISRVDDAYFGLMIAPNTEITIQKAAITSVLPKGTLKSL